jgi:oligopeptide transport system substrate-binding protein
MPVERLRPAAIALFLALTPAAGHDLTLPIVSEPVSLDPHKFWYLTEEQIAADLYEGLTVLDAADRVIPGVADHWETAADGLTWTFHLRADARWSDGSPVTAEDFVYSFRRAVDPATASPYAAALMPIAGAAAIIAGKAAPASLAVTAPDPATLKISLAEPTPWLLGLLAHNSTLPVPRKAIEAAGEVWARPGTILTNGPYILTQWVPHAEVTIERNPFYREAASVRIAKVRRVVSESQEAQLKSFQAGELDVVYVPGTQLARMRGLFPGQMRADQTLYTNYLTFNLDRPPLGDARIRRALSMVIDRDVLIGQVERAEQRPATALVAPGIPGYTPQAPDWAAKPMPERIAAAQDLLKAAIGPDAPLPKLTLLMSRGKREDERNMLAITEMWKNALGIEASLDLRDSAIVEESTRSHQFQIALIGWYADYADPWTFLASFRADAESLNTGFYRNPDFDALLDRSRHEGGDARMATLEAAERLLAADPPVIPFENGVDHRLINPHLKGWESAPLAIHPSRYLDWVE